MIRKLHITAIALLFLPAAPTVRADVPRTIPFEGVLTDTSGLPLEGSYAFTFSLYADTTASPEWSDTRTLDVKGGFYETVFDVDSLSFTDPLFLGIAVDGSRLGPMMALGSVPYALSIADGAVSGKKIAPATVVRSINSRTDSLVIAGGGNVEVTTSGDTIRISSSAVPAEADSDWTVKGDTVYTVDRRVGIGTASPTERLVVGGDSEGEWVRLENRSGGGKVGIAFGNEEETKFSLGVDLDSGTVMFSRGADFFLPTITIDPWEKIGIGTRHPNATLDVNGSINCVSSVWIDELIEGKGTRIGFGAIRDVFPGDLHWNPDSTRFELNYGMLIDGPIRVGNDSYQGANSDYNYLSEGAFPEPVSGMMDNQGDLYVENDLETGGALAVGGLFTVTSIDTPSATDYNYIALTKAPAPVSQTIDDGNDLYVWDDIEAGGTISAWNFVDLQPGPAKSAPGDTLPLATARSVLSTVRAVSYPETGGAGRREKRNDGDGIHLNAGFLPESVPAEIAGPGGVGVSIVDLIAVLTRVVQDQDSVIAAQNDRIDRLEEQLSARDGVR